MKSYAKGQAEPRPPRVQNAPIADDFLPPLVQAALVHAHFGAIHPFDDGNVRAGRARIHVVLRRRGLASACVPPISVVLAKDRDPYISGLEKYRENGLGEWVEHFATPAARSADLASAYLAAVERLMDEGRTRLADGAKGHGRRPP